ncbi:MAG: glycoside hydrolase family 32 protein [Saprospiraceae bacterium]|nr:glycoside hydrolase family 32 protein [Saprospiraceae bacterium]
MRFFAILMLAVVSLHPVRGQEQTALPGRKGNYKEQHRPQFHFSPERAWMNDPNGLVYYAGEYHLFYQYYPDSTVWGPMHWGHAVSKNLVHWEHLPVALFPDSLGCIFSGSVVVDEQNTSGFAPPGHPEKPLVAIFTYHNLEWERAGHLDRESQGIAYSLDRGRTWSKYAGNPVLPNKGDVDFRDPKVFWHDQSKHWVMPLAVGQHLEIFISPDLKSWQKTSDFGEKEGAHGGVWECPDLFPLKTPDGKEKWVLIQNIGRGAVAGGSGTQYFIGSFDGKRFKNDNPPETVLWLDYGADNYAGVTWFNAPGKRRIFIGWMSNWDDYAQTVPTERWRSAFTVPRILRLGSTNEGLRLFQEPVTELKALRKSPRMIESQSIDGALLLPTSGVQQEFILEFDLNATRAKEFGLILRNRLGEQVVIGYDREQQVLFVDRTQSGKTAFSSKFPARHNAPLKTGKNLQLHILADASSVEIFAEKGRIAITELFFPNEDYTQYQLYSRNGPAQLQKATIYPLKSIW